MTSMIGVFRDLSTKATATVAASKHGKGSNGKADLSTIGIVFMACLCSFLPLDMSQLTFAILGAILYALLQRSGHVQPEKKAFNVTVDKPQFNTIAHDPKPHVYTKWTRANTVQYHSKPTPAPTVTPEIRAPSVQPIVAPTFQSDGWDGEIQELLAQITPTGDTQRVVSQIAQLVKHTTKSIIPDIDVHGFANGNLTFGKAFGVAVPEVDIVAIVSENVLFHCLHGRNGQSTPAQLDAKKLQKTAIRTCTDRLVNVAGLKFRRSAFRGSEPKVTLLAPASLGLFSESVPIDFSINVVTPLYNAALLAECGKMDSRAFDLILLVKRWAKDRGICHAAKGHLSPYMWGLLTIYFLQVGVSDEKGLLPPLDQFQLPDTLVKRKVATSSCEQHKAKQAETGEPKKSAGALFKEFVHFYETQFDWRNEAVSIQAGRRAPPALDVPLHIIVSADSSPSQVGPSIQDPFQKAHNLGDGMNAASLARLKEELSRAETLCTGSASLSELLEPWVPAEAAEAHDDEQAEPAEPVAPKKSCEAPVAPEKSCEVATKGEDWRRDAMQAQASATPPPWRRAKGSTSM